MAVCVCVCGSEHYKLFVFFIFALIILYKKNFYVVKIIFSLMKRWKTATRKTIKLFFDDRMKHFKANQ